MSYVWHYLIARLLYEQLIRRGGVPAVLVVVLLGACAVASFRHRRAKRRG